MVSPTQEQYHQQALVMQRLGQEMVCGILPNVALGFYRHAWPHDGVSAANYLRSRKPPLCWSMPTKVIIEHIF